MIITGIYKLLFKDGTFYIGQAVDIEARYKQHSKDLADGRHSKKMQCAYKNNDCVCPDIEILLDCHKDYLDIFECFYIHKFNNDKILNTSIPKNILGGLTQKTLDMLVDNRNNSIIYSMGEITEKLGKLEGLRISLAEAEEEIENLEHKRSMEEIEKVGKKRFFELRNEAARAETAAEEVLAAKNELLKQLDAANSEIKRLRERNIIERILNT